MAIQSAFYNTDGTTRTFPSTKHIASSANVAVWLLRTFDNVWEIANTASWVLANNSIIFDVAPQVSVYSQVEIRIADEADELESSPSDISLVSGSIINVNTVANDIANVNTVAGSIGSVQNTSGSIANVNTVAGSIVNVNSVATTVVPNIAEILLADDNATIATTKAAEASASAAAALVSETNADTSEANALSSANTATTQAGIATTQAGIATTQATNSASSATAAQLSEWVAEAERLTAYSYATEAEDTFVNIVTSDGDGTFTYTPATEYSALHYKNKAQASASSVDLNLLSPKATTINATANADITLTATQNGYGRIIITDTSVLLTTTRNVIVDTSERSFLFQNDTAQSLVVKTSAGVGITVVAGGRVELVCDGTNVVKSILNTLADLGVTATATELNYVDGVTSSIQTQLNGKAALASPALTGTPTAPTAPAGTNTTQIATTAFVLANSGEIAWVANDTRAKTALNASGTAPIYACRAWVNFTGTDTVAIRASGNVSSITDNGVGNYTVNFTIAMPDANYICSPMGGEGEGTGPYISVPTFAEAGGATLFIYTTTAVQFKYRTVTGALADIVRCGLSIFR